MFKHHNSTGFGLYDHNLTLFIFSILGRRNGHKEEMIIESHESLDDLVWKTKR